MTFEELLENPELYRCGENYKATNIVFPVEIEGKKYIFKKPRTAVISSLIQRYYSFQDNLFYGNRAGGSSNEGIRREIAVLERLGGFHVPKLFYYSFQNPSLVREFLEGKDFGSLSCNEDVIQTLEGALESMVEIHQKNIFIGDAHVKNTFLSRQGEVYWLDFDGFFDTDISKGKMVDIIKFVYSTFTTTRDEEMVIYAAELVAQEYPQGEVRRDLQNLIQHLPSKGLKLWFPTRLPNDGKLHEVIKKILIS